MMLSPSTKAFGEQICIEEQTCPVGPLAQGCYLLFQSVTGESGCPMFLSSISRNAVGDIAGCLELVVCIGSDEGLIEAE